MSLVITKGALVYSEKRETMGLFSGEARPCSSCGVKGALQWRVRWLPTGNVGAWVCEGGVEAIKGGFIIRKS